jgi:acetolactate synthase I/II/III large subunit
MHELASGHLAVRALAGAGVRHLFTLSGGHIFPLYDGCRHEGLRIIDTRHEQAAMFGAEGLAKLTRRPQVAALTAGPGVTNAVSAIAGARFAGSPVLALGGRAPQTTWGAGSLQEIDHTAFLGPLTKHASTAADPASVAGEVTAALRVAASPHRGPAFVDVPMDVIYTPAAPDTVPAWRPPELVEPDPDAVARARALLAAAQRPVVVAGTDVWLGAAEAALGELVTEAHVPVVMNGLGRGCVPADHPLAVARARGAAFAKADLVVVVGTPLDFRLGFGRFGEAQVVHVADHPSALAPDTHPAPVHARVAGDLTTVLRGLAAGGAGPVQARTAWSEALRDEERAKRVAETELLEAGGSRIHPGRVYGELRRVLDRDAVVIGDGGDFVSFAGRLVDSYTPGCWLDPGPYGCLGTGMGYALAARLAHPQRQVVTLLGDGAAGFGLMDAETLVRHGLPVVMVVGNNGIWGLEKFPMQQIYDGWHAAADLQAGLRYDDVVSALNGAGETVERPEDLGPALERAFRSDVPYLVNVLTDPTVAYPRRTLLA